MKTLILGAMKGKRECGELRTCQYSVRLVPGVRGEREAERLAGADPLCRALGAGVRSMGFIQNTVRAPKSST